MRIASLSRETDSAGRTAMDIPWTTIVGGTGIIGVITAVSTFLTNWLVTVPKNRQDFQLQLLQKCLAPAKAEDRANSLRLLVEAGLLEDPEGKISALAKTPGQVPQWPSDSMGHRAGVPDAKPGDRPQIPPEQPAPKPSVPPQQPPRLGIAGSEDRICPISLLPPSAIHIGTTLRNPIAGNMRSITRGRKTCVTI